MKIYTRKTKRFIAAMLMTFSLAFIAVAVVFVAIQAPAGNQYSRVFAD